MKPTLRDIDGKEAKTLMALLWEGKGGKVQDVDLGKYGITPDQAVAHMTRLSSLGILRVVENDGNYGVEFLHEWAQLADRFASWVPQLKLQIGGEARAGPDKSVSMKQIKELAVHYAILKGCPTDKLGPWFTENFRRGIRAFKKVLEAGGDLEKAKRILSNAAHHYGQQGIQWSVEGAVLKNLHRFIPKHWTPGGPPMPRKPDYPSRSPCCKAELQQLGKYVLCRVCNADVPPLPKVICATAEGTRD